MHVIRWLQRFVNQFRLRFGLPTVFLLIALIAFAMAWNASAKGSVPIHTGRNLDLAIFGGGYFQVTFPSGQIYYTRCGHFSLNSNGNLVAGRSQDNLLLEPAITLPQDWTAMHVPPDGLVQVSQGKFRAQSRIGQIALARFINDEGLSQIAPNFFGETESSGPPFTSEPGENGAGFVYQGWLEPSAGQPQEQLRYQLALVAAGSLAMWIVFQNRALHQSVVALRRDLENAHA